MNTLKYRRESGINSSLIISTCFNESHIMFFCISNRFFGWNTTLISQIALVSYLQIIISHKKLLVSQPYHPRSAVEVRTTNLLHSQRMTLKLYRKPLVLQQHLDNTYNHKLQLCLRTCYRSITFLASYKITRKYSSLHTCIPNLRFDNTVVDLYTLGWEFDSYSRFWV